MNALDLLSVITLQDYRDQTKALLSDEDYAKTVCGEWVGVLEHIQTLMPESPKLDVIRTAATSAMRKGDDAKVMMLLAAGAEWLERREVSSVP